VDGGRGRGGDAAVEEEDEGPGGVGGRYRIFPPETRTWESVGVLVPLACVRASEGGKRGTMACKARGRGGRLVEVDEDVDRSPKARGRLQDTTRGSSCVDGQATEKGRRERAGPLR
jgi:hypothetical protein